MDRSPLTVTLSEVEAAHLLGLLDEFIALLRAPDDEDPALERLTPNARPDDDDAAAEFRHATRGDLLDRRLADAVRMRGALTPRSPAPLVQVEATVSLVLDDSAVAAWLRTLSAMRLVIASRLGIQTAHTPVSDETGLHIYEWLGYRLDQLVQLADEHDQD